LEQPAGQAPADTEEKLNGMRKTIARRMGESWTASPRVCFENAVDCTAMKALREQLKTPFKNKGIKLTFNHIIIRAVAQALSEFPSVNASLEGDVLKKHGSVNIGLAVGVDNGLLVPNLKNCASFGLEKIAQGVEGMIDRARGGKLGMDELSGGTFTITNLGMYGMRSFSPIINQPELAILGVNAMIDTPVAVDGKVEIRPMMNLNLVADHRVIDGVLAAQFLARIVELLENPVLMLA
jgi:pyruvate dehydrogenase E2 component (dihydrolipoamide acetyltransferase)